jgi:sugar phosphate permease
MKLTKYRWEMLFWLFLITLVSYFDRVNFAVAAPVIMKELAIDVALMGIIMSGFNIGYTIMNFAGGVLASKYSARKYLVLILIFWSIMTIVTGFGWSFISLLVIRIVFGLFEGPLFVICTKLVKQWMRPAERGRSLGIISSAMSVGIIIGLPLSALVVSKYGWPSIFYIFGAIGIVLAAFVLWRVKDSPAVHPSISIEERRHIEEAIAAADGAASATLKGTPSVELLKQPLVWLLCFVYFSFLLFSWANLSWMPTYFMKARGVSLVGSGFLSAIPYIAGGLGPIILGYLSDKEIIFKYRGGWVILCLVAMVPLILGAVLIPSIVGSLLCFAFGTFFALGGNIAMLSMAMGIFDQADVPKVSGFMMGSGAFAGILAPSVVGFVVKATNSFNNAYYAFAVLAVIGAAFALILLKKEKAIKLQRASAKAGLAANGQTA